MGMPNPQQQNTMLQFDSCPKYNWAKLDSFEKIGVNMMDAIGAKNAVFGGMFGIFIFGIAVFFFRKQLAGFLMDGFFKKK